MSSQNISEKLSKVLLIYGNFIKLFSIKKYILVKTSVF